MSMICINGGLCTGCMACQDDRYYDPVDEDEIPFGDLPDETEDFEDDSEGDN